MGCTVSELSQRLTAAEESAWIAFHREDPFGDDRADLRSAQIAQLIYNTNAKKQDRKKITDFMPFYKKRAKVDPDVSSGIRSFFGKFKKE